MHFCLLVMLIQSEVKEVTDGFISGFTRIHNIYIINI